MATEAFNNSVFTYMSLIMPNGSCCGVFYAMKANFTYF